MVSIKYVGGLCFCLVTALMESRIKKQALGYGVVAILLVTVLAAFAYELGVYKSENGAPLPPVPTAPSSLLATFTSHEAIKTYLLSNSATQGYFPFFGPADTRALPAMVEGFNAEVSSPGLTTGSADYSGTNIQVAGVDEADIVKTDGNFIYAISGNAVLIVKAYPPHTAEVVARIALDDLYPVGLFVDGDRLAILGSKYFLPSPTLRYGYYTIDVKAFARIYDIHDRTKPVLLRDLVLTGSYFNSRMMGDYVYFVVSQPAYVIYDTVVLPKIYANNQLVKEIVPSEIHYFNGSDNYYQYTVFIAVNMQNTTEAPTYMTLMLGGTSSMYVSRKNMYITFPEFNGNTTIYRVSIQGNNMTAEAKGQVQGNVLNQFSMDEYDSHFRIATAQWVDGIPRSNLFIMDMDLGTVGSLLNIEVGETLDSARFMGDRCYLSTSVVRRDPFFVIDVGNASKPEILGYLKIPGFTRYLHPYDEDHVIGVGRDESNRVRISLFDVSNVTAPKNMSEYRFEGDWSDTTVLWDHKAFLFDYSKDLLAIPASTSYYGYGYPYKTEQALFVFNITITDGLIYRGSVTHQEIGIDEWNASYYVGRALYIQNVLYTVSEMKMKLNDLESLTLLKEISLS